MAIPPTRFFEPDIVASVGPGTDAGDRALANALPHIVWTCDATGELEWVNDRWFELTGLSDEATLHNKGALAAVHPDDRSELAARWQQAIETTSPTEVEYRIRTRNGEYRWHVGQIGPMRDSTGSVIRWVATAFDIQDRRAAADALRASERRFETIFHLSPQPSAITRAADGTFLDVNAAFVEVMGFSRQEAIGKTGAELGIWTVEERAAFIAPVFDGAQRSAEAVFRTRRGRDLRTVLAIAPVELGGEQCFVSVVTDVTDRRAVEDALRKSEAEARARADDLAAVMDAVPAAVWISHDRDCHEIYGNRAGHEVLRVPMGSNLSKTATDSTPTRHFTVHIGGVELRADQLPLQRAARGEEFRNYEEELRFSDGKVAHLFGNVVPLRDPDGTPRGAIGAFLDVTRLKEVEDALRRADHRKDEFLALLSHELRNPLTPILTSARLLELHADSESRHEIEVIARQVKHLVRLVDDLLDMSRVSRGAVTLTKTRLELRDIVKRAVDATAPLFEEQNHTLEISVASGLIVDGDEVRLTQVVDNLLSNAARYTPPGGWVTVEGARESDSIVLHVRDTGVGIDPTLLPDLFEVFVQGVRGPDRAPGGLGIGLSLVRHLTELHGGTVAAHSEGLGRGSQFSVRLPVATASTAGSARPDGPWSEAREARRKARVLIVDDHHDVVKGLSRLLSISGYDVRAALTPTEALEIATDFRPQVAILDIGLPEMDGYKLAGELRSRLRESAPVLIALSGYSQADDRRRSEASGFAFHLVKPLDIDGLLEVLERLVPEEATLS
ncbi:MAG TPA: PAS domain S-box protein [Gemmatimonadaceae bacterium]|jgi:PAS domain S-box-containing protein|nr:PAS domain S-box protein [Gemmatimonadaceae bacterium]